MKGDFTRDTFDRAKHFSSVLMQQGRVMLDADHNEQSAILLHYIRILARDLIGPYAAPVEEGGFVPTFSNDKGLMISPGRYYVDGILVENEETCPYGEQPDYSVDENDPLLLELKKKTGRPGQAFWLYLDVWERHVTALDDGSIRESALGGPDTCTRAKVVWQVKALALDDFKDMPPQKPDSNPGKKLSELQARKMQEEEELKKLENDPEEEARIQTRIEEIDKEIDRVPAPEHGRPQACDAPLTKLLRISAASLRARLDPGKKVKDPCVTPPDSKYRGAENQLYRVEIHHGGKVGEATFKWSRDNGSHETAWLGPSGDDLHVASTRGFTAGNWVELSHDRLDFQSMTGPLVKLSNVEDGKLSVEPDPARSASALAWSEKLKNPRVRRWNQTEIEDIRLEGGAVWISESSGDSEGWIDLEDGVQIQFTAGGIYQSGDYWLIPARAATGGIEWPLMSDATGTSIPQPRPPHGVEHHYAPLGLVLWRQKEWSVERCRCDFEPLSSCFVRENIKPLPSEPTAPGKIPSAPAPAPGPGPSKRVRGQKKTTP